MLAVPSSILAVVDLSGSMKIAIGDTTRVGLAVHASQVALDAFPAQARIGIWGFSKNRGANGASWAEYATLERLDAQAADGKTHGDVARSEADKPGGSEAAPASWTRPSRPTSTRRRSGTRRGSTPW